MASIRLVIRDLYDPKSNFPKYAETDVNRLAVNAEDNPHPTLTLRKADRDIAVGVANNVDTTTIVDDTLDADDGGKFWNEPETSYNAKYPHNHVYETEGGHIKEFDDTVGAKRIHERYASGTGTTR